MRRRGIRVFALVAVIVALSIAALSIKNFDISLGGASIKADGDGPLGITLGLDLQGGSHLQYQADLPDEVDVTFQDEVEESDLRALLGELGQSGATVAKREFTLLDLALEEAARGQIKGALEGLAPIEALDTGDGSLEVTFRDTPDEADLRSLLDELGLAEATIEDLDERKFIIGSLSLEVTAQAELRNALGGLAPTETVGTGDDILEVTFRDTPNEVDLRRLLDSLGYAEAPIQQKEERVYTIQELSLAERAKTELSQVLDERLAPIEAIDTGDGILLVTFRDALREAELRSTLDRMGYTDATIESPAQRGFTIGQLSLDQTASEELRRALEEKLGPIEAGAFIPTINAPTPDQMKGVRDIIQQRVNALGTTEPIIQTLGDDRVVVQLPGVGGSSVDVTFQSIPIMMAEIATALQGLINTGANVEQSDANNFIIRLEEALAQEDMDALEAMAVSVTPGVGIEATGDNREIAVSFPPAPNEFTLGLLLEELGHADYTAQQQDASSFTIRTGSVLATTDQVTLREELESRVGEIVTFEARGGVEEAKQLIGETAQLEFKERECVDGLGEVLANPALCQPVSEGGAGRFVDKDIDLSGEDLKSAFAGRNPTTNANEINIAFKGRGTGIFSELTRRIVNDETRRLVVFLDDEQLFAATVRAHIQDGRTRITGNFTREEVRNRAIQLESGRLPVPLTLVREGTVDALLGADSLRKSLIAGLVGLGLVLLFMIVYYRMAGVVAATALLVYAAILLAIIKLVPVTLTLSGIAGLVLSVGMAVDANILIFERMKEELRAGRTLTSSMEVGFRRAWVAIRDSNVSTIITCAILFLFGTRLGGGTPVVTGLAVTLLIGVSVSMFTAMMVSRNMLQILALTPVGKRINLFTPEPRRQPVGVAGGGK